MKRTLARTPTDESQLRQIVAGLAEGVILVGPDRAILWANASACEMHGVSAVAGLGRSAADYCKQFDLRYRNHHKVPKGSYPIERVIAREVLSNVVVVVTPRARPDALRVHRVRSLIVNNAKGKVDYFVLFLVDVTDWASAEHRFEKAFNANPAPALICRLSDLRYVKVNRGFLEMTGYASDYVLGRSVYELDVFDHAHDKAAAVEKLAAGATIPQMQAEIRMAAGDRRLVIVAGEPIEVGDEACMLFTFMDLEPRRIAEDALRQSEERFAKAFQMTPVPTLVCKAGRFELTEINEAFAAMTGRTREELIGLSLEDADFLADDKARAQMMRALHKAGSLRNAECVVRGKDDTEVDCLVSAEAVRINGTTCFLITLLDITHRKRSEAELATAIDAVMEDASWFSRSLIEKLANVRRGKPADLAPELADLSRRERDVLDLICEGLADKEIASRLGVSPSTVRNHVASVYSKLDVHRRGEAIAWARERGLFGISRRSAPRKAV